MVPSHRVIRLGDLHVVHIERTKPKPQSVSEQKLAIRQLGHFLGQADPLIHEITFEQAEQFYDTLKWLPKSMTTSDLARPLVEIAEAMRSGTMQRPRAASATAAKKLQLINAMFGYAAGQRVAAARKPVRPVGWAERQQARTEAASTCSGRFDGDLFRTSVCWL